MRFALLSSLLLHLVLVQGQDLVSPNVVLSSGGAALESPSYLITAPKILTALKESVCLVLFKDLSLPDATITVRVKAIGTQAILLETQAPLSGQSQCVSISTENLRVDRALLQVTVGNVISEVREIGIRPAFSLTIIETSKAVYRPQQELQFRVFTFNPWLRPVQEKFERVWIENSRGLAVMQWKDVQSNSGLISLTLPVADDNLYGVWKVKAITRSQTVFEKDFEIRDFDAPKIVIKLKGPEYVLASDLVAKRQICVRNELGYPVAGKIKVVMGYQRMNWDLPMAQTASDLPFDTFVSDINGCHDLTLNASVLGWGTPMFSQRKLLVNAQFMDKETSFIKEKSIDLSIAQRPFNIMFPSSKLFRPYFKANLPFFGHLLVEHPDYSPAQAQKVTVCYESRRKPWVSESQPICQEMVSTSEGIVNFNLPPMGLEVKQVFLKAHPSGMPAAAVGHLLHPWYSMSQSNMLIKPSLRQVVCKQPLAFDVLFSNSTSANSNIYYQIIGRGTVDAPKLIPIRLNPFVSQLSFVGQGQRQLNGIQMAKISIKLPPAVAALTPMSRVILYYRDPSGQLVADSSTFLVDCLDQGISMSLAHGAKNMMDLQVEAPQDSVCALSVGTNEQRHAITRRKIMKLLEKFDVSHELLLKDRCELQRMSSLRGGAPYSSPYSARETVMPTVLDYKDSWDAFNDVGLTVSSDMNLDNGPCVWDEFPNGVPADVLKGLNSARPLLVNRRVSKDDSDRLALIKLEKSLLEDLLYWKSVTKPSGKFAQQIAHSANSLVDKVYGSAICLNAQQGLRIASSQLIPQNQLFTVDALLPLRATLGEVVPVKVYVKKLSTQCVPMRIAAESSPHYEVIDAAPAVCVCENNQVFNLRLRAKAAGKLEVKLIAKYPQNSLACENAISTPFPSRLFSKEVTIYTNGITIRDTKTHLLCNEQGSNVHKIQDLTGVKKLTISTDLLSSVLKQLKQSAAGERSALDILAALAPFGFMRQSYGDQLSDHLKQQLEKELSKAYQSLMTYKLSDGSYSLFGGRKATGDLSLTVSIFKVLAQIRRQAEYINDQDLRKSIQWIYSRQAVDGCFYVPDRNVKLWPLHLKTTLQATSYVVSSLLEAGVEMTNMPIERAMQCIRGQVQAQPELSDVTNAMLAHIEAKRGNAEQAKYYLNRLSRQAKIQNNLMYWTSSMSQETAAYALLANQALKETTISQQISRWLLTQNDVWKSPICSYALIKAWPQFKPQTDLKLQLLDSSPIVLNGFEPRLIPNKVSEIRIEGKGCAILQAERPRLMLALKQTSFKVTVEGLERGYNTCHKRLMRICLKEKEGTIASSPLVKMQIMSGFDVDDQILRKSLLMSRANLLNHFRVNGRDLYMYLKPLTHKQVKSQCFEIPLIQRHEIEGRKPAFIQVYDYHQGSALSNAAVDTLSYTIPKVCHIVEENKAFHQEKRLFSESQVVHRMVKSEGNPLHIFDCPEDVSESCPVCKNEVDHKAETAICKSDIAAVVKEIPWRTMNYEALLRRVASAQYMRHHRRSLKPRKCIAVPLKMTKPVAVSNMGQDVVDSTENLYLYMLEECKCSFVKDQSQGEGLVLLSKWERRFRNQFIHQLTGSDHLINLPLGETKFPKCKAAFKRTKRWTNFGGTVTTMESDVEPDPMPAAKPCPEAPQKCPEVVESLTDEIKSKACQNNFSIGQ